MSLLGPRLYDRLQTFVHGDFSVAAAFFLNQFKAAGMRACDSVTDIGSGTGLLSTAFTQEGVKYVGLEMAAPRVEAARVRNPEAQFLCGNLNDSEILKQLSLKFCIMHGVIHHLSDEEVFDLVKTLREKGCKVLATMDPLRPAPGHFRPFARLVCNLDEGKFIRTEKGYRTLFSQQHLLEGLVHKASRWPAEILYMAIQLG